MSVIVYEMKPMGFQAKVEIAACYVEVCDQLLLLQCAPSKEEAGKWGVPAGKIEAGESSKQGAIRELFEETGILVLEDNLQTMGSLYIKKPHIEYVYHLFRIVCQVQPEVVLSIEHADYRWCSFQEIEGLPLMLAAFDAVKKWQRSRF